MDAIISDVQDLQTYQMAIAEVTVKVTDGHW